MRKKIFSCILAIAVCVSLLWTPQMAVFAVEDQQAPAGSSSVSEPAGDNEQSESPKGEGEEKISEPEDTAYNKNLAENENSGSNEENKNESDRNANDNDVIDNNDNDNNASSESQKKIRKSTSKETSNKTSDNEGEETEKEPSFKTKIHLIQDNGNKKTDSEDKYYYGTKNSPAMIDYVDMVLGGGYWYKCEVEYEGLEPNTEYNVRLDIDVRNYSPTAHIGDEFTTNDKGSGKWNILLDLGKHGNLRYKTMYDSDITISGNGKTYNLKHSKDNYNQIYCIGSLEGSIVAQNKYTGGEYEPASIPVAHAEDGIELKYSATITSGLWEDEYEAVFQIYKMKEDESFEKVGAPIVEDFTIEEYKHNLKKDFELGTFKDAKEGETYAVAAQINPKGDSSKSIKKSYYDKRIQFTVFDKEEIKETENRAPVTFMNYDGDTDNLLAGVGFELIDKEGNVVRAWTSTGEPEEFDVPAGEYVIHQTSVPEGYEIAGDVTLSVSEDSTTISGALFQGSGKNELLLRVINGNSIFRSELGIEKIDGSGEKEIAYCVNLGKITPADIDAYRLEELLYREYPATNSLIYKQVSSRLMQASELGKSITRVVYNGYPNNNLSLKEKYNLKDEHFRDATQKAIWYFTNNKQHVENDFHGEPGAYEAYKELIEADNELPADLLMRMYVPASNNYQTMVSVDLSESEGVSGSVRNYKKPEEPKPEEPETPDEPDTPDKPGTVTAPPSTTEPEEPEKTEESKTDNPKKPLKKVSDRKVVKEKTDSRKTPDSKAVEKTSGDSVRRSDISTGDEFPLRLILIITALAAFVMLMAGMVRRKK